MLFEFLLAGLQDETFYVQVLNSNDKMIGVQRSETFEDGHTLLYNTKTKIPYKKEDYTICELILPIQQLGADEYAIQIYHDQNLLLSTGLSLK